MSFNYRSAVGLINEIRDIMEGLDHGNKLERAAPHPTLAFRLMEMG